MAAESLYENIVALIEYLSGAIHKEVSFPALAVVIATSEALLPKDASGVERFGTAVHSVERHAAEIFVGHAWFRDSAISLLKLVSSANTTYDKGEAVSTSANTPPQCF